MWLSLSFAGGGGGSYGGGGLWRYVHGLFFLLLLLVWGIVLSFFYLYRQQLCCAIFTVWHVYYSGRKCENRLDINLKTKRSLEFGTEWDPTRLNCCVCFYSYSIL